MSEWVSECMNKCMCFILKNDSFHGITEVHNINTGQQLDNQNSNNDKTSNWYENFSHHKT